MRRAHCGATCRWSAPRPSWRKLSLVQDRCARQSLGPVAHGFAEVSGARNGVHGLPNSPVRTQSTASRPSHAGKVGSGGSVVATQPADGAPSRGGRRGCGAASRGVGPARPSAAPGSPPASGSGPSPTASALGLRSGGAASGLLPLAAVSLACRERQPLSRAGSQDASDGRPSCAHRCGRRRRQGDCHARVRQARGPVRGRAQLFRAACQAPARGAAGARLCARQSEGVDQVARLAAQRSFCKKRGQAGHPALATTRWRL